MAFQKYVFSTYGEKSENSETEIGYEELEGRWRYIWLGYTRAKQTFTAAIIENEIETKSLNEVLHKPLNDFISLTIGKDINTIHSFHGHIFGLALHFGTGAYIQSSEELKKLVLSTYALPAEFSEKGLQNKKRENVDLIGDIQKLGTGKDLSGTTWSGAEEYSIQGWFKINSSDGDKDCQVLFRVTDNEPNYLGDKASQGDRTFFGELCDQNNVRVSTYNLLGLKDFNEAKHVENKIELEAFSKSWVYIYMGYSNIEKLVSSVLHIPSSADDKTLLLKRV